MEIRKLFTQIVYKVFFKPWVYLIWKKQKKRSFSLASRA